MGHRVENKATSCLGLLENKLGVFFLWRLIKGDVIG